MRMIWSAAISIATALLALTTQIAEAQDKTGANSRGEYLTRLGDCVACHSVPGAPAYSGGLYMDTPFGRISTPNITPDKDTGIGNWTDDQFYKAMHEGIGAKGEYLYPVFPFPWYTHVTRDDVLAIKAYLFTLKPVNAPRQPLKLSFPASIRDSMLGWRVLFFKSGEFKPDPNASAEVNRGDYLVEGLGHCGECHNHQNVFGASKFAGNLEGGEIDGWYAPNITSDGSEGVGQWSTAQITTFLKSGASPHKGVVLGPMQQTISESLKYLTDADANAIAAYLKAVPAKAEYKAKAPATFASGAPPGEETYLTFCSSCHQQKGTGVAGQIPALAGNGAVTAQGPQNVINVVLGGLTASHGLAPMPAVGAQMTDQQVADSVNYVRNSWGNAAPEAAEAGEVAKQRAAKPSMLAGNLPDVCPAPDDAAVAKVLQSDRALAALNDASSGKMLEEIDRLLPRVKSAAPHASDDAIVNSMTVSYCGALKSQNLQAAERSRRLGDFGMLVYGQLKSNGRT